MVTVNDFLEVLLSDPGPQCLMWFPLTHRMASVENGNLLIVHNNCVFLFAIKINFY